MSLKAQVAATERKMNQMSVNAVNAPQVCEFCAGNRASVECQVGNPFTNSEQVNYLNNFQKRQGNSFGNPYSHNYNPNWRTTHPNLSWSNNQNAQQQTSKLRKR